MTIKTEKFTTLTPGYYKLVDKEGWLDFHKVNPAIHGYFDTNDIIKIASINEFGEGENEDISNEQACITIGSNEYKFFEKVVSEYPVKSSITGYDVEELSKINVPFGKLDKLTKLQLVEAYEDGEGIEFFNIASYNPACTPTWSKNKTYRVHPKQDPKEAKKRELANKLSEIMKQADEIKKELKEI